MDALPRSEGGAPGPDLDALPSRADEVNFDPPITRIENGLVLERLQVEIGAKLAIDPAPAD